MHENSRFDTLAIHAGYTPEEKTGSRQVPIYQTAAYVFDNASQAADRFALREIGPIYSRTDNPTNRVLEQRIAALEGGVAATAASSGIAAQMLAFAAVMGPGDHAVVSNRLYGGSSNQWRNTFPRHFGWEASFVDITDHDAVKAAITDNTKLIFAESIANPSAIIADMEALGKIADEAGIPLMIDNTMATPYLCRPIEWGAEVVIHSTTKFLNGQCTAMGGAVVSAGKFDWNRNDKFPMLTEIDPTYNIRFSEQFGELAYIIHTIAIGLRDFGPCQSPFHSFLTLNGMETLGLRMQRHADNAQAVAEFLRDHAQVEWVSFPGLNDSAQHGLKEKYMPKGAGAVFMFGVKGGFEAAKSVAESVKLFSFLANIGDSRSLIIHPASTTHSQLNPEQMKAAGIGPETLRISIGIEDIEDIKADLDQALRSAAGANGRKAA